MARTFGNDACEMNSQVTPAVSSSVAILPRNMWQKNELVLTLVTAPTMTSVLICWLGFYWISGHEVRMYVHKQRTRYVSAGKFVRRLHLFSIFLARNHTVGLIIPYVSLSVIGKHYYWLLSPNTSLPKLEPRIFSDLLPRFLQSPRRNNQFCSLYRSSIMLIFWAHK
jgi:hypothetical protein